MWRQRTSIIADLVCIKLFELFARLFYRLFGYDLFRGDIQNNGFLCGLNLKH